MTWKEIKKAIEDADVKDDDDIRLIHCEIKEGDKTFHKMRLGTALSLSENVSPAAEQDSRGCAV